LTLAVLILSNVVWKKDPPREVNLIEERHSAISVADRYSETWRGPRWKCRFWFGR